MSHLRVLPWSAERAAAVATAEYRRLLGLPRGWRCEPEVAAGMASARAWYATEARPFVALRRLEGAAVGPLALPPEVRPGTPHPAHAIVVCVASAGREVDMECERLWACGRPDAAFFLERLGAAVTERLARAAWNAGRCLARAGETLLPHRSPGCGPWPLAAQADVMGLLTDGGDRVGPVHLLPSGALWPKNSLLAVAGLTHGAPASALLACRACGLPDCGFRRAPGRSA